MDDVDRDVARAKLAADMQKALTLRQVVVKAIEEGTSLEYLSLRYSLPLEKLRYAKSVLEKRAAKEQERLQRRGTA